MGHDLCCRDWNCDFCQAYVVSEHGFPDLLEICRQCDFCQIRAILEERVRDIPDAVRQRY